MLWTVSLTVFAVVAINFVTSYGHIYAEGLRYGEYGVDARLMPVGIDGMLLALGLANLFAARFKRGHWLLRAALGVGVAGTVAANGAYGAHWGMTGGLLATWSPVALFITVEAGLFMYRVSAEWAAERAELANAPKPKREYTPRRAKSKAAPVPQPSPARPRVVRGELASAARDPFHAAA
jgi:hypothetical protein